LVRPCVGSGLFNGYVRESKAMKPANTGSDQGGVQIPGELAAVVTDLLWDALSQSALPTMVANAREGNIIRYSAAMSELTGFAPGEVSSIEAWLAGVVRDGRAREELRALILGESDGGSGLREYEGEVTRKDGGKRHVKFSIYAIESALITEGGSDFRVVEALDISVRKLALEELRRANERLRLSNEELDLRVMQRTHELEESENRLRMALEGANEGLWVINFAEKTMLFSEKSAQILGYTLHDLGTTSERWDNITHPNDWPRVQKRLKDHFEGKTSFYEAEYRARTKSGGWKWILGHGRIVKRDKDGTPLQAIGTHVDITKLKETEIALRRSEAKFRSLVEQAPFGLVIVTLGGKIEYFNPQFKEIFGYEEGDLPDMDAWFQKAYPDATYQKEVRSVWNRVVGDDDDDDEPLPEVQQSCAFCRNGDYKIVRVKFVPLIQKGWLLAYEDISEIAKAHDALEKRERELELKNLNLEEVNTALKVLLKRREDDKNELEEKVFYNVRDLVLPYLTELEQSRLTERQSSILNILKSNLSEIVSPFSRRLAASHLNLTPKELKVANLLKQDKTTKEISELLCISESSVVFHRHNIRRKLGLVGEKANLKTYLQSLVSQSSPGSLQ
jgi:PAS domain S-box-containing protein